MPRPLAIPPPDGTTAAGVRRGDDAPDPETRPRSQMVWLAHPGPGPTVTPARKAERLEIVEPDGQGNISVADPDGGRVEEFRLLPPPAPTSTTPTA